MVKTPEAIRFYALAINVERNLKKKKYNIQQRLEVRKLLDELCAKTADEMNNILKKEKQDNELEQ